MTKRKIVYTPGVFDLLHKGHLNVLKRAKLMGDYLIVGVCSDDLNEKTKGKTIVNEAWRAEMLQALSIVDEVYIYSDQNQSYVLDMFMVDVFAVGEEFGNCEAHQKALDHCHHNSIDVVKIKRFLGISSSELKEKVNRVYKDKK